MLVQDVVLFSIWGHSMSLLELIGLISGLVAVYLASKALSVNFLFGLLNNVVYFVVFYQAHLYSAMLLQTVYFFFSLYGYFHWKHPKPGQEGKNRELRIRRLTKGRWVLVMLIILVFGGLWSEGIIYFQSRFPELIDPPAFPRLDAVLTVASVTGQFLLSRKVMDNWIIWIVVDVLSTALYAYMGLFFTAILFVLFTLIAIRAIVDWNKQYRQQDENPKENFS
ncbi:MAG: nicotinamide riboside transporter PnuC [Bacteroidales bacterium]|nr:nicotinamide riboside transporter PnuC [Bacteroidales bacterium]MDD3430836.1 nicotinamide riboside transporter PnuC [Bacteroidales bacterium]MDD4361238.1 nicotinamide riboside transporter PnuC [Bacteroidales bacterium]MDD4430511.1 nicotinamide riboside transporter PnuC [Bacteroidales bacterium]